MEQHQIIGLVVFAVGIIDAGIGHFLVAPRIPDESKRNTLKIVISVSSLAIAALGVAIYAGRIPIRG